MGHLQRVEIAAQRRQVRRALLAEIVRAVWRIRQQRLGRRLLGIQQAQRVDRQPAPIHLVQAILVGLEIVHQRGAIAGPALGASRGVELKVEAAIAQPRQQHPRHGHDVEVHRGIQLAQHLDVPLVKLAVAAGLRRFMPEDRPERVELDRSGPDVHPVLDVRAHHARGELRPQRDVRAALILEGVHFLVHDVGAFADAADEEAGLLEDRGVNLLQTKERRHSVHLLGHIPPVGAVDRQDVLGAANCLIHGVPPGWFSDGGYYSGKWGECLRNEGRRRGIDPTPQGDAVTGE